MAYVFSFLFAEINKVRVALFHLTSSKEPFVLPSGEGAVVTLSEKVFVPVKDHPDVSIRFDNNFWSFGHRKHVSLSGHLVAVKLTCIQ